jgi:MFS family permease
LVLVGYGADVVDVVRGSGFRRLLSVRATGQLADGVFQTALVSYALFSPERQADAQAIASAFAILLLPYCFLGPFAGVLIDRWRRRQILLAANLLRAGLVILIAFIALSPAPEYVLLTVGVIAISVNRLVLSALGASIPRVVSLDKIVTANAIAPTVGTLATVAGAGVGYAIRQAAGGAGDTSDAIVMASAAGFYLVAALLALRLAPNSLGPDAHEAIDDTWEAIRGVARGLVQGLRELKATPPATDAFVVTAAQRFGFGVATVTAVLLMRNAFNDPSDPDAGLAGLATAVTVVGIGILLGAITTPFGVRVLGERRWVVVALSLAAVTQCFIATTVGEVPLLVCAGLIGFASQSVKVCVDSVLQRSVPDNFRGRTFALYDVVFNTAFVGAAVIAAFVMPATGVAPFFMIITAAVYAAAAVFYTSRSSGGLGSLARSIRS